ncbi:hypothetical protein I310_03085 [Cryptococcus deuterogattii CA1014]|nr:hypothetical protein I310_03085 [Cryptococcus deuterogattii CA1014]
MAKTGRGRKRRGSCFTEAVTYSPENWPDYDPIMAPNGYYHDAETNSAIWMPNWDHLKCHFQELPGGHCENEGEAEGGKGRQPAPQDDPCQGKTPERELIRTAFDQGILKSLLVDHMEGSVHGLSTSRNPLNSQNDEDLTLIPISMIELRVLCDLYEQERIEELVGISESL